MDMKRIPILLLAVLIGAIAVHRGVESSGGATVDSQDATAAKDSGKASGEVSAVLFGEEATDGASSLESPSASLRLLHDTAETEVAVTLNASESTGSSIALYQWDLDGDGSYDATTEVPTFAHVFGGSGMSSVWQIISVT